MSKLYSRIIFRNILNKILLLLTAIVFCLLINYKSNNQRLQKKETVTLNSEEQGKKQVQDAKQLAQEGWDKYHFNNYVSSQIGPKRELPDVRGEFCKLSIQNLVPRIRPLRPGKHHENIRANSLPLGNLLSNVPPGNLLLDKLSLTNNQSIPIKLPTTTIIIPFWNEAWSALTRTVHSILLTSPPELIEEIILVDDYSYMIDLGTQLDEYFAKLAATSEIFKKVKIIRLPSRKGLIQAKNFGAKHAKGETLTFMDGHMECTPGWLEPLLMQVAMNHRTVSVSVEDIIDHNTLKYIVQQPKISRFSWELETFRDDVPREAIKKQKHLEAVLKKSTNHLNLSPIDFNIPIIPFSTPAIKGGAYSINKSFFEELGMFDEGLEFYGGDDLELSFKVWMCGGKIEICPCSHVGHITKDKDVYKVGAHTKRNRIRVAEVWMDEYAQNYYKRIRYDLRDYGDLLSRKQLRQNLKCKNFRWYLHTVYPELIDTGDWVLAYGKIQNFGIGTQTCLHLLEIRGSVDLTPCNYPFNELFWMVSKKGEIKMNGDCLNYNRATLRMIPCQDSKKPTFWKYRIQEGLLRTMDECLGVNATGEVTMLKCNASDVRQKWSIQYFHKNESVGYLSAG